MSLLRSVAMVTAILPFLGCGGKNTIVLPPPTPARVGWQQEGVASWYGHPYHGRRTSNGETYNMNLLTAAHLSLPFDTWVRVTNLSNKRSVEVRVNDRGPFVKRRIIDLSREAAQTIGMIGTGTARVRVQVVATPSMTYAPKKQRHEKTTAQVKTPVALSQAATDSAGVAPCREDPRFGVQVGSFAVFENAERLQGKMTYHYGTAQIFERLSESTTLFRVIAGMYSDRSAAEDLLNRLRKDGVDGFVTRVTRPGHEDCL